VINAIPHSDLCSRLEGSELSESTDRVSVHCIDPQKMLKLCGSAADQMLLWTMKSFSAHTVTNTT